MSLFRATDSTLRALRALALTAAVPLACGGGQTRGTAFDPAWTDDHGTSFSAFQQSFRATKIPLNADVAVAVAGRSTLLGVPLDPTIPPTPWTFSHPLDDRPSLAGNIVVALGRGELFALDARTGALLWRRPAGGRLRGAGDDGAITVISLVTSTDSSTVLAINRAGLVVRQLEDTAEIGTPAVVDGYAFLPWGRGFLSVYDLAAGEERARIRLPHETSRAFTLGGALFFGENDVTRFDENIGRAEGTQATRTSFRVPSMPTPIPPIILWGRPGSVPLPRESDVSDKVRLYARPIARGPAGIEGGRFLATKHRAVVAFDAASGAVSWRYEHPTADFVGGAACDGGFALCDAAGKVTLFDGDTGLVTREVSLGKPVDSCVVQVDALKCAATLRVAAPPPLPPP